MRKYKEVICVNCQKPFNKELREVERNIRRGYRNVCSTSCRGQIAARKDKNPFDLLYKRCVDRTQKKGLDLDISKQFLEDLYESQKGLCAISNLPMSLDIFYRKDRDKVPYAVSVDRVENSVGYYKSNVRLVCLIFNYMKNTFSDSQLTKALEDYWKVNQPGG